VPDNPSEDNVCEPPAPSSVSVVDVEMPPPGEGDEEGRTLELGPGEGEGLAEVPGTESLWQPVTTTATAQTNDHATSSRRHRIIMRPEYVTVVKKPSL